MNMKSFSYLVLKKALPDYLKQKKPKITRTQGYLKHHLFIMRFLLLYIAFLPPIINLPFVSFLNEITLKVQGKGLQTVLNPIYYLCPENIYLNGQDVKGSDCHTANIPDTANEENTLRLVWNTDLYSTISFSEIFENLTNILEVDLTGYDTSKVNTMLQMFFNCSSLTSINLSNMKTSLVETMRLMFGNCYSLEELDVTSFDTSKVTDMHFMFNNCKKI